eukprot:4456975-Pleurochrysis_carterae.AAC.1
MCLLGTAPLTLALCGASRAASVLTHEMWRHGCARARALPWRTAVRAECGGFEFKDLAASYNLCAASTC